MGLDGKPLDKIPRILVATPYYDHTNDIYDKTIDAALMGAGQFFDVLRFRESTSAVDMSRNNAAKIALENGFDFVFFADADMGFPSGTLLRLLAAMETEADERPMITSGVYCLRNTGFNYAVYNRQGDVFASVSESADFAINSGIYKADAVGTGCMLVRTELFNRIDFPWFKYWYAPMVEGGEVLRWSEDLVFGLKCCDIGVHVFVRTDILCKHELRNCSVFPTEKGYDIEVGNMHWTFKGEDE